MPFVKLEGRSLRANTQLWTPLITLSLLAGLAQPIDSVAGTVAPKVTVYGAQVATQVQTKSVIARQVGQPDNMDELIRRLLVSIRALSHYDAEVEMPVVRSLPLESIHMQLCGGPCMIRAAYVPGDALYIDEAMHPLTNKFDQSILFHELVHHVQEMTTSHSGFEECQLWRQREIEAYALQNEFLSSIGVPSRTMFPGKICAPTQTQAAIENSVARD
jgi:hypothetical protein